MIRTFKDKEVVLVALEEALELDDAGMIDTAHNLDFFENVGSLQFSDVVREARYRATAAVDTDASPPRTA